MLYVLLDLFWLVPLWCSLPDAFGLRTNMRNIGTDAAMMVTAASALAQMTRVTPSSSVC